MELTIELTLLTQQLDYRQHQRERDQVRNPYMSMDHVQYRGNLYLNTYNVGWQHYPNLSWETNQDVSQPPQAKESKLEDVMVELANSRAELENYQAQMVVSKLEETLAKLARGQADLSMPQAELESSMVEIENS